MPCPWAVYETKNGEVYIAKMNIALMSKMYFGVIGKVMKEVAETEKEMFSKIRRLVKEKKLSSENLFSDEGNKGVTYEKI